MAAITNNDRLLIEKHLDNALNDAEKILFNQRLEDTDFKQEVVLYAQAVQAVYRLGDDKIKAMLQKEQHKLEKKTENAVVKAPQYKPLKIVFSRQKMALAASFLLLVSVGLWFLIGQNAPKLAPNEQIFKDTFKPHDNLNYVDGRSVRSADIIGSAVNDTVREFGGALGGAVIGAVIGRIAATNYASSLHRKLDDDPIMVQRLQQGRRRDRHARRSSSRDEDCSALPL